MEVGWRFQAQIKTFVIYVYHLFSFVRRRHTPCRIVTRIGVTTSTRTIPLRFCFSGNSGNFK